MLEIKTLRLIRENKVEVEKELGRLSNGERLGNEAVYLMQLPGVGIIVTMTILSAIGDIRRFESPKKLVGNAGLGAGVHDSGQKHCIIRSMSHTESGACTNACSYQIIFTP